MSQLYNIKPAPGIVELICKSVVGVVYYILINILYFGNKKTYIYKCSINIQFINLMHGSLLLQSKGLNHLKPVL